MAAAFDAKTDLTPVTASPCTGTHTPVGTPTLAVAWVLDDAGTLPTTGTVTYGSGGTMTLADSNTEPSFGFDRIELYYRISPASGAQTVTVPWTGGSGVFRCVVVKTYTGSNTSTPLGTATKSNGSSTWPISLTINGASGDVADMCLYGGGSDQTANTPSDTSDAAGFDSSTQTTRLSEHGSMTGSTKALSWSGGSGTYVWVGMGVAVKAAAGGSTFNESVTLSGTTGFSLGNIMTMIANLSLAATAAINQNSAGSIYNEARAIAATAGFSASGGLVITETIALGLAAGFSPTTLVTWAPSIALGVNALLEAGVAPSVFVEAFVLAVTAAFAAEGTVSGASADDYTQLFHHYFHGR